MVRLILDEHKRLANLTKHKLDFSALTLDFFLVAHFVHARAGRLKAIGWLAGSAIVVVFAPLGTEAVAIISMRPASRMERLLL